MKCDCGGTLSPKRLQRFDFTPFAGVKCELRKVPGLRCGRCAFKTIPGDVIARVLAILAVVVTEMEPRLAKEPAVFLRKRLRLTQQQLADRMGITRETVAKWESGMTEISPVNDTVLRTIVLSHFVGPERAEVILGALKSLDHVRTIPPRKRPSFVLDKELKGLRAA